MRYLGAGFLIFASHVAFLSFQRYAEVGHTTQAVIAIFVSIGFAAWAFSKVEEGRKEPSK